MSQQQPKFHEWFHKSLIWFFLWILPAFAILFGAKFIVDGVENGYHGMELTLLIIVNALLIAVGLFTVKARFDLAAFRRIAPKELLIASIVAAALCLANYWVEDFTGDDLNGSLLSTALILVCWGIAVYRYYNSRPYLFRD